MLVNRKLTSDLTVRPLVRNRAWDRADRAAGALLDRAGAQYAFYPSTFGIVRDPWFRDADVVQLHNAHGGYFTLTALPVLSRVRPIVWTLHDQWPMTGHIIYSRDCERWRTGCGACPYLSEYAPLPLDTTAALWRFKRAVYWASRLELVSPSRWLAGLAGASPLLRRFRIHHIPYGVDLDTFSPGAQTEARSRLELPLDRRIVLFVSELAEERKGFHLLAGALETIAPSPLLLLMTSGARDVGLEARAVPASDDERRVADAYKAADLVVVPSLADNFPNVVLEAMACGTPCVAFDTGGIGEAVRAGRTGFLVAPTDVRGLTNVVKAVLEDAALRRRLGHEARRVASAEYGLALQSERYLALYQAVRRSGRGAAELS